MSGPVFTVEKVVHQGRGLVRDEAGAVFVPYVLPGEQIRISIVAGPGRARRGEVTLLLTPSPDRVTPLCPLFARCGGCQLQHASYPAQLAIKRAILAEDLDRLAGISVVPAEMLPSPREYHYRSRIRLHARRGVAGFLGANGREFVPVTRCEIAEEAVNEALADLASLLKKARAAREVELMADDDGAITAVAGSDRGEKTYAWNGPGSWRAAEARIAFRQVNPLMNERLTDLVAGWCRELSPETALELYAGAGNLTAAARPHCQRLFAVESDPGAVELARRALGRGSASETRLFCMDAQAFLEQTDLHPDLVILDPPRGGAKAAVPGIVRLGPGAIIYVSCEPATLARDLAALAAGGYQIRKIMPLDMFPQTAHLETAVLMGR